MNSKCFPEKSILNLIATLKIVCILCLQISWLVVSRYVCFICVFTNILVNVGRYSTLLLDCSGMWRCERSSLPLRELVYFPCSHSRMPCTVWSMEFKVAPPVLCLGILSLVCSVQQTTDQHDNTVSSQ